MWAEVVSRLTTKPNLGCECSDSEVLYIMWVCYTGQQTWLKENLAFQNGHSTSCVLSQLLSQEVPSPSVNGHTFHLLLNTPQVLEH